MKVDLSLINADTIEEYQEHGVCVVRNLISPEWIERMGEAIHGELFPLVWSHQGIV